MSKVKQGSPKSDKMFDHFQMKNQTLLAIHKAPAGSNGSSASYASEVTELREKTLRFGHFWAVKLHVATILFACREVRSVF